MELSKFMKHKEREVVTLLTLILGGGQGLYIRKPYRLDCKPKTHY